MGLFGGTVKPAGSVDPQPPEDGREDQFNDIPELPEPRTDTTIAKDITVSGNLHGEGVVQIEGVVEGEINLKGYVIVTSTGRVQGPVEADVIRIAGQVEGNLVSHDHVQLERTGTVNGDVTTVSFVPEQASVPHVESLEPSEPAEDLEDGV